MSASSVPGLEASGSPAGPSPQDAPRGAPADRGPAAARFPVAYIAHYFPALAQTFVYREILELERLGWPIRPFSIRRPTKGFSEEARDLAGRTFYVLPLPWGRFLARHVTLFLAHPIRYLRILLHLLTRPRESLRSRLHGLTHFFGGIFLVPELRRAGVRHFHAHFGMNPTTLAMVAAEYLDIPFSMTIHARDLFVDTALLRAKLEKAKFVVTISEYNRRILRGMLRRPDDAGKIHVVHCGIDPRRFAPPGGIGSPPPSGIGVPPPSGIGVPPPSGIGAEEASPAERPRFLAVGRLVQKKGYRYLVEAARILKERGVPFEVRVIGGGPDQGELERMIEALGVSDRVELVGPLPQERVLPELRRAAAFVLPCVQAEDGDRDGIPVSLMEAMACEVPCISTTLSGIPELIESGKAGLLVPEKDPEALAGAMETLGGDAALRRAMGREARAKVEEAFTLEVQGREIDRLLLEG